MIGLHLFLQLPNFLFVLGPFLTQNGLILCHFLHKMFLFFGIIMLQTLIHLIVQLGRFSGCIILSFDQSLDMFLKLIYMDFILFLSLLVLLYLALTSCYRTFMLFYCIFQQLNLTCYVVYYALLYCHHFLQFCVLLVHFS